MVLFVIILSAVVYFGYTEYNKWWQARQELVKLGFAENKFPYRMLTEKELVEKGLWSGESPALNAVPTRITPEETYAIFRQALIDGDIDKAAECFVKEKQDERRQDLIKARKEGRIKEIIEKLNDISPERKEITRGSTGESSATYELLLYREGAKPLSHPIFFLKDWNGDWKMENI